jgi:hypothetical protein
MSDHEHDDEHTHAGGFAEGQAAHRHDKGEMGRFSEGQEALGEDDPEKHHAGDFAEGQEKPGEEHGETGRYSEGQEQG